MHRSQKRPLSKRLSMSSLAIFRARKTSPSTPNPMAVAATKAKDVEKEVPEEKNDDGQLQQSMQDIADMKKFSEELMEKGETQRPMPSLSEAEEAEIAKLLQQCEDDGTLLDGAGIKADVNSRMQQLEEANIDAVVSSRGAIDNLVGLLDGMLEQLDDVDEWIGHYNRKLRSMQKHVEQIKAENATLETVTRNKHRLASLAQEIIVVLHVTAETERCAKAKVQELNSPEGLLRAIETAEVLRKGLAHPFSPGVTQMRAVKEQREKMTRLKDTFVKTLILFFKQQFGLRPKKGQVIGADGQIAPVARSYLVRDRLFQRLAVAMPLLQWIQEEEGAEGRDKLLAMYETASRESYKRDLNLFHQHVAFFIQAEEKDNRFLGLRSTKKKKMKVDSKGCPKTPSKLSKQATIDKVINFAIISVVTAIEREYQFSQQLFDLTPKEAGTLTSAIFSDLFQSFESLLHTADATDHFYLISILSVSNHYIEKHCESECAVIVLLMTRIQTTAKQMFNKFIDEAMASVKDFNQKSGVLPVMKKLPLFFSRMESYATDGSRGAIQPSYHKLVSTIFSRLNQSKSSGDTGDKHRLLILKYENFFFFVKAMEKRDLESLQEYVKQARKSYEDNLQAYIDYLLRRNFGPLMSFFEQIDDMLHSIPTNEIQFRNTHSLSMYAKVAGKNTETYVEKKVEKILKKVEQLHASSSLTSAVRKALATKLVELWTHWDDLARKCYEKPLAVSPQMVRGMLK